MKSLDISLYALTWNIDIEEETVLCALDAGSVPAELFTLDLRLSRHVVQRLLGLVGHGQLPPQRTRGGLGKPDIVIINA